MEPRKKTDFELARLRSMEAIINRSRAMVFLWRVAEGWPVEFCTGNVSQLGYTREDFMSGRVSWPAITHPEDDARLQAEVEGYLRDGITSFTQRYRLFGSDGSIHWVEDETTAVFNGDGEPSHFEGVVVDVTGRVRAEQALQLSESRYRQLLDQLADGVVTVTPGGRVTEVNERICEMLGVSRSDLIGVDVEEYLRRILVEGPVIHMSDVSPSSDVRELREIRTAKGRQLVVESRTRRLPDGSLLAIVRDMTDQVRAERALRESEANFRALAENAGEAILIEAPDGRVMYANAASERLSGYRREELVGMPAKAITAEADRARVADYTRRRLAGDDVPTPYTAHVLARNGDVIPVEATGARTVWKGRPATIGMLRDIRERLRTISALRESEANLAEAQRIARLGSWEWEPEQNRIRWSAELRRIWGLDPDGPDPTYDAWLASVDPDDRSEAERKLRVSVATGAPFNMEYAVQRPDGSRILIRSEGEMVTDAHTGCRRLLGTAQDVTEQRRTAQALARSHAELRRLTRHLHEAREAERSRIAREIHDELGQSLTALKLDLHWLGGKLNNKALRERVRAMMDITDGTVHTVQRLASELKPALLDDEGLEAAVRWHLEEFHRRCGIRCQVKFDPLPALSRSLRTAVFRVFQEAATNVARHSKADRLLVCVRCRKDRIYLRMRDDGQGFVRNDVAKAGAMGLIGMRERVEERGGRIRISSRTGRGTSIVCWFPRSEAQTLPGHAASPFEAAKDEVESIAEHEARSKGAAR